MTNKEIFEQYGSETWAIESNLCFLLQEYWDKTNEVNRTHLDMPINPVGFAKEFMDKETYLNIPYVEQSKMDSLEKDAIDVELN